MFVVLKPVEPREGFFATRRQKKELSGKCAEAYRTKCGLPFMVLDIFNGKSGIDYKEIKEKCGRYSSRLILPESIEIPETAGVSRFVPSFMPSLLCFNSAVKILSAAALPPESFSLTLIDPKAVFAGRLSRLIPLCSEIKIVTERPEIYIPYCTESYEKYGASVMLRQSCEKSRRRDAVICCDENYVFSFTPDLVFTSSESITGTMTVYGSGIELNAEHSEIIGENINPVTFAGALTELCSCREYVNSCFKNINIKKYSASPLFDGIITAKTSFS